MLKLEVEMGDTVVVNLPDALISDVSRKRVEDHIIMAITEKVPGVKVIVLPYGVKIQGTIINDN